MERKKSASVFNERRMASSDRCRTKTACKPGGDETVVAEGIGHGERIQERADVGLLQVGEYPV